MELFLQQVNEVPKRCKDDLQTFIDNPSIVNQTNVFNLNEVCKLMSSQQQAKITFWEQLRLSLEKHLTLIDSEDEYDLLDEGERIAYSFETLNNRKCKVARKALITWWKMCIAKTKPQQKSTDELENHYSSECDSDCEDCV